MKPNKKCKESYLFDYVGVQGVYWSRVNLNLNEIFNFRIKLKLNFMPHVGARLSDVLWNLSVMGLFQDYLYLFKNINAWIN